MPNSRNSTSPETLRAFFEENEIFVSRETWAHLEFYANQLVKWQSKINLVGSASLEQVWTRHFLDSAQLFPLLPTGPFRLLDMGSGAGFPGMVLAILTGERPGVDLFLCESDGRKCAFLQSVLAAGAARATVCNSRLEALELAPVDVIVARALAPVDKLLSLAQRFSRPDTVCLFPKGEKFEEELARARDAWTFKVDVVESKTSPRGKILVIRNFRGNAHG